jgi:hypothetical protein
MVVPVLEYRHFALYVLPGILVILLLMVVLNYRRSMLGDEASPFSTAPIFEKHEDRPPPPQLKEDVSLLEGSERAVKIPADFRRVLPGEFFPPGVRVIMDLSGNESYVPKDTPIDLSNLGNEKKEQREMAPHADRIDLDEVNDLRDRVKPVPKIERALKRTRPQIDKALQGLSPKSATLLNDLMDLDAETLDYAKSVAIWASRHLPNLLQVADVDLNPDAELRLQAATVLFNSVHNVLESTALAIPHVPTIIGLMRKEVQSDVLFKLLGCIHDIVELHGSSDAALYETIVRERVWEALLRCTRPLGYEKSCRLLVILFMRSRREQQTQDIQLLMDTLVQVADHMAKRDAARIIAPACTEQDFKQNTGLSPYCNEKVDI